MNYSKNKKTILGFLGLAVLAMSLLAWQVFFPEKKELRLTPDTAVSIMLDWHEFALKAERACEGFRMPIAARVYGYTGIAAWEAARPLLSAQNGQLKVASFDGLKIPEPPATELLDLPTVLNACYSTIFQKFFMTSPLNIEQNRLAMEQGWSKKRSSITEPTVFQASVDFGKKVAEAVYDWSATDTIGHMAYLHIYDDRYKIPVSNASWQPCDDFPMPPLLPHWGESRCFVMDPNAFVVKPPPPFSMDTQSPYYSQALEIYTINSPLSPENQWIAEFWSDDLVGLTFTSAGRWISICNQVVRQEQPSPTKALETYLKAGIAVADASVICWKSKYQYSMLRPETYIRRTIQRDWRPILHTPSHPSYPSGHAMLSAAVAEVLTQLYGQHYEFTDRSHENRKEFKGKPRHFHSFYEMAFEDAASRIALGVHYRMDCDEGTRLGLGIGKKVAAFPTSDIRLEN